MKQAMQFRMLTVPAVLVALVGFHCDAGAQGANSPATLVVKKTSREEKLQSLAEILRALGYDVALTGQRGPAAVSRARPTAQPWTAPRKVDIPKFVIKPVRDLPPTLAPLQLYRAPTGGLDRLRANQKYLLDQEIGRIIKLP